MNKLGLKRGTVELISEYDFWKVEFEKEKTNLQKLLGENILGIEHIGSTSIPNLLAKPIIDILLGVESLEVVKSFQNILESNGYTYRPNGSVEGEMLFVKGTEEDRTHYLHITRFENKQYLNDIFFRDYLTKNENEKKEYENLKVMLARTFSENREEYTKRKTDFIQSILQKKSKYELDILEKTGNFLFHGTENPNIKIFEPRQAYNYKGTVGEPDGEPAVFASDRVDYAILMAIVNKNNCPSGFSSGANWTNGILKLRVSRKGYQQLDGQTRGYVYVFNKTDFEQRNEGHTEYVSYKLVEPVRKFGVKKSDLSQNLQITE